MLQYKFNRVKMKFVFPLLLTVILFHLAFLKNVKRNRNNKLLLTRLTKQLSKVKGFKTCNLYLDARLKSTQIGDMLQSELTKSFPIMTIGKSKRFQITKFKRRSIARLMRSKKREQRGLMNCASGNAILIAIVAWEKISSTFSFSSKLTEVYRTLALKSSVPKVLVVSITSKKHDYRRLFKHLASSQIIDVDILEISKSNRKVKRFLKAGKVDFTVQKFNPFFKSYAKEKMGKNVTWFETKLRNLNGLKLLYEEPSGSFCNRCRVWGRKVVKWYSDGPKSYLSSHFRSSMNITFACARLSDKFHISLEINQLGRYALHYTSLKSFELEKLEIYTPMIYDRQSSVNIEYFMFYSMAVVLTLMLLQICCIIGSFDGRTWSPYEVVKMLFGFSNSRNPSKRLVESALFCLISLCGICIANFLSDVVTDMLVPIEEEHMFNTFVDLRDSNITLYLCYNPVAQNDEMGMYKNPIILSNVSYQVEANDDLGIVHFMGIMVNYRNMSVSVPSNNRISIYNAKIVIDSKLLARRSDLAERLDLTSYEMKEYSPYYDRISDLYWRFSECGFSNVNKMVLTYYRYLTEQLLEESVLINKEFKEDSESVDNSISDVLILILSIGVLVSLVALLVENVYFYIQLRYRFIRSFLYEVLNTVVFQ